MKNVITTCVLLVTNLFCLAQELPNVSSGSIKRIENFQSKFVDARNVDVWLPNGYNSSQKYNVVYMHDGQMLFDANITSDRQTWDVDDVAGRLMQEDKTKDFIVVGVWSIGKTRHSDYFPQKAFESLTPEQKNFVNLQLQEPGRTLKSFQPASDNYLKFLVSELKPLIDSSYSVYTDPKHTFIAGSSMGGLISMYAICEYPNVFGGAACLSTHWIGIYPAENNPVPDAFVCYLKANLPDPKNHKIYFDYGDQTLDALYPPLQQKVDHVMKEKGFTHKNWLTMFFPGGDHTEKSWNKRLDSPLLFLLKK